MTRFRAPVWLIAPAAAFLGYYALLVYCDIFRPENPGMEYQRGTLVIDKIAPGSPADRAGLQVGDDVVTVDGHPIVNRLDIEARDLHLEFDRPRDFMVVRPTGVTHLSVVIGPARPGYLYSQEELVLLGLRAMLLVTMGLGLLISWRRPRDPAALLAAGLLASSGVFSVGLPYRAAGIWGALPALVGVPMWLPFFAAAGIGAWAFAFFSMFPERRRWAGGIWMMVIAPLAISLIFYGAESVRIVYRPDDLSAIAAWRYRLLLFTNIAYILAGLATLVVRYRRLTDAGARRRLRVLMVGSLIGWLSGKAGGRN